MDAIHIVICMSVYVACYPLTIRYLKTDYDGWSPLVISFVLAVEFLTILVAIAADGCGC